MSDEERRPLLSSRIYLLPRGRRHYIPGAVILFVVFLERLAFYSLTSNLYLFLNQRLYDWTSYNSMNALLIFTGTTYVSCLIGGLVSDSAIGRFSTIAIGLALFSASYLVLPFLYYYPHTFCSFSTRNTTNGSIVHSDCQDRLLFKEDCSAWLLPVIIVAAIGSGTVQTNIVPFGVEQVRYRGPEYTRVYLNWFYWCVNLGGCVAVLAIGYVQQNFVHGFFYGYLAPAVIITIAFLLFTCSRSLYSHSQNTGKTYIRIYRIIKEAYKSRKRFKARQSQIQQDNCLGDVLPVSPSCLDMAKVQYGGKFHESAVEDVKALGTIIIVFVFLIPYWVLYFQMQTTFLNQGLHMRLGSYSGNATSCDTPDNQFVIPAAWLTVFDIAFLFLVIPLMDWVVYPWLNRRGLKIPLLCQILIGMVIASFSVLSAGVLEMFRRQSAKSNGICQVIEKTNFYASDMMIFWQIPQYSLMGMSEVFTSITGMEFACSQAPSSMQGVIMGLFYFFTGMGSFIGSIIIYIVEDSPWLHLNWDVGNINDSHLENYFFFLCGFQIFGAIIFFFVSTRLKIRRPSRPTTPYNNFQNSAASSGGLDRR